MHQYTIESVIPRAGQTHQVFMSPASQRINLTYIEHMRLNQPYVEMLDQMEQRMIMKQTIHNQFYAEILYYLEQKMSMCIMQTINCQPYATRFKRNLKSITATYD